MPRNPMAELLVMYFHHPEGPRDDVMSRVAYGQIAPGDAVEQLGGDEEARRKVSLFAPPSASELAQEREAVLSAFSLSIGDARRKHSPGRPSSRWLWAAGVAAAAALLVLVVARQERSGPAPLLHDYAPEWSRGYAGPMRAADGGLIDEHCDQRLRAHDPWTLRLRPSVASEDDVTLATLATPEEGTPRWLKPAWNLNEAGVISVGSEEEELGLAEGRWVLMFFVARTDAIPSPAELVDMGPGRHPGVTAIRSTLCVVPDRVE